MATTIPLVTVTNTSDGFLVRCETCLDFHTMRRYRYEADIAANDHQASHTPGRRP